MKKFLLIAASALILSACGESDKIIKDESTNNESSQEDEVKEELLVEVGSVKYYEWIDESTDDKKLTVYAELTNKSDVNVEIDLASVAYMGSDDEVLAAESEFASQDYLLPNQTVYLTSETDDQNVINELSEVEVNPSYIDASDVEITEFKISDENIKVGAWSDNNSQISVTGSIKNESDIDFEEDEITISMGLYDEEDNLIGVENIYSDQIFALKKNEERKFEFGGGGPLPDEIKDKIDHIKISAIGIKRD